MKSASVHVRGSSTAVGTASKVILVTAQIKVVTKPRRIKPVEATVRGPNRFMGREG